MDDVQFVVDSNHLKLLKRMCVSWNNDENGAPEIDCKRPYGNSNVVEDIAEILGWGYDDEDEEMYERAMEIHCEMEVVLQILLYNLSIQEGTYEKHAYGINWKLIN